MCVGQLVRPLKKWRCLTRRHFPYENAQKWGFIPYFQTPVVFSVQNMLPAARPSQRSPAVAWNPLGTPVLTHTQIPSGYVKIAIENGHLVGGLKHEFYFP